MPKRFSEKTVECLRDAGWEQGRSVDIEDFKKTLDGEECESFDEVDEFLTEFGGLKVHHPHHKVSGTDDYFIIDPAGACEDFDPLWVTDDYSERTGEVLCPIGEAHRGHMVLAMGETGAVYAGYEDILHKVADSGAEAIENLCCGYDPEEIP